MKNLQNEVIENAGGKKEDIDMYSVTPVLAGRKLNMVPESPFLTANTHQRDGTPLLKM